MKNTEEVTELTDEEFTAYLASLEPMQVSALFEDLSRQAKEVKKTLDKLTKKADKTGSLILDLIIEEKLPGSFKRPSGANIHTQSQLWASAKDHAHLARVLESLGKFELLPKTVNSHSLSAYVREFVDDETGEIVVQSDEHPEGIPQELLDALNVNTKTVTKIVGL
jgi:hypothetical protein